jgi:hypothetical protein
MRRYLIIGCVLVVGLLLAAPVEAQTAQDFTATFKSNLPKKELPTCGAVFCATGTVEGFGSATFAINPTSFTPTSPSCADVTAAATITLADGSGWLDLSAAGELCFPGNSGNAPGALRSFGNPSRFTGSFTIVGGIGVFAGASGGGTATLNSAGAHLAGSAIGTVSLP